MIFFFARLAAEMYTDRYDYPIKHRDKVST